MSASTVSARIDDLSRPPVKLFALAELDVLPEVDHRGDFGERDGGHQGGTPLGEVALAQIGVGRVEHDRDGLPENRVAEELEPLIGRPAAVLVGPRPVGQGEIEKIGLDGEPERTRQ